VKIVVKQTLRVPYEGHLYHGDDVIDLPAPVAYGWLANNWAVEAD
jgi:hypothetical protein